MFTSFSSSSCRPQSPSACRPLFSLVPSRPHPSGHLGPESPSSLACHRHVDRHLHYPHISSAALDRGHADLCRTLRARRFLWPLWSRIVFRERCSHAVADRILVSKPDRDCPGRRSENFVAEASAVSRDVSPQARVSEAHPELSPLLQASVCRWPTNWRRG